MYEPLKSSNLTFYRRTMSENSNTIKYRTHNLGCAFIKAIKQSGFLRNKKPFLYLDWSG